MGGVDKVDTLEGFEDERHDDLERILSEGLAHTDTLACKEGHEGHGMVVAALSETLGLIGVVVFAPLVFVMMQLMNIDDHHVTLVDSNSSNVYTLSHAKRGA